MKRYSASMTIPWFAMLVLTVAIFMVAFQNCGGGLTPNNLPTVAPATAASTPVTSASSPSTSLQTTNCVPGNNLACHQNNGSGNQVCNSDALTYTPCTLSSCDSGYSLSGTACFSNVACAPGTTAGCSDTIGRVLG
jgi:hypothetical protein